MLGAAEGGGSFAEGFLSRKSAEDGHNKSGLAEATLRTAVWLRGSNLAEIRK